MKNLNVVIIILLAILLFNNSSFSLPSIPFFPVEAEKPNMAMYFEFAEADSDSNNVDDVVDECQCGGDGDVGDGNIKVPCPCVKNGGTCNCPKSEPANPTQEMPADWTYAVLFTNDSWCVNCIQYEQNVLSKLHNSWIVTDREGGYVHIVKADENSELVDKYRNHVVGRNGQIGLPTMIVVRNGNVKWVGKGVSALPQNSAELNRLFQSVK